MPFTAIIIIIVIIIIVVVVVVVVVAVVVVGLLLLLFFFYDDVGVSQGRVCSDNLNASTLIETESADQIYYPRANQPEQ